MAPARPAHTRQWLPTNPTPRLLGWVYVADMHTLTARTPVAPDPTRRMTVVGPARVLEVRAVDVRARCTSYVQSHRLPGCSPDPTRRDLPVSSRSEPLTYERGAPPTFNRTASLAVRFPVGECLWDTGRDACRCPIQHIV
ncbi:hypothetical protein RSAG8_12825, partial [Rhizoctonia solani AG-8 WAC10335]